MKTVILGWFVSKMTEESKTKKKSVYTIYTFHYLQRKKNKLKHFILKTGDTVGVSSTMKKGIAERSPHRLDPHSASRLLFSGFSFKSALLAQGESSGNFTF